MPGETRWKQAATVACNGKAVKLCAVEDVYAKRNSARRRCNKDVVGMEVLQRRLSVQCTRERISRDQDVPEMHKVEVTTS